jgi:hypothetical protein
MSVRALVYQVVAHDAQLITLGLGESNTFANGAPDSPPDRVWGVLRWGPEVPGLAGQRGRAGRVTDREVTLWVYDKQHDYGRINDIIKRWCEVMEGIDAQRTGIDPTDGWVVQCDWQGDGDDTYDDVYEAWAKPSTYRIIASGD